VQTAHVDRRKTKLAVRPSLDLSLEEQASSPLLKATGALGEDGFQAGPAAQQLGEALCRPLQEDTVVSVRASLRLPATGGTDTLADLLSEVGEACSF
jgi:hypothetical protein